MAEFLEYGDVFQEVRGAMVCEMYKFVSYFVIFEYNCAVCQLLFIATILCSDWFGYKRSLRRLFCVLSITL